MPGVDLAIDATGRLNHIEKVAAGDYQKVTVDSRGHVIAGGSLTSDDLENIDIPAGSITGEIGTDQLAECSVTGPKICDYATCLMQEDNPGAGDFLGQFWVHPVHSTTPCLRTRFRPRKHLAACRLRRTPSQQPPLGRNVQRRNRHPRGPYRCWCKRLD